MSRTKKRLTVGVGVVAEPGRLENAEPFDRLEVTAVHHDGTVDVRISDLPIGHPKIGARWDRVDPADLIVIQ